MVFETKSVLGVGGLGERCFIERIEVGIYSLG